MPWLATATMKSVCRHKQRRRLQDVDYRGDLVERRVLVNVRQHGHVELDAHALENPQALLDAEAPKPAERAAIGLVERRLEHERHRELRRNVLEPLGRRHHERFALDDARAGDEE